MADGNPGEIAAAKPKRAVKKPPEKKRGRPAGSTGTKRPRKPGVFLFGLVKNDKIDSLSTTYTDREAMLADVQLEATGDCEIAIFRQIKRGRLQTKAKIV